MHTEAHAKSNLFFLVVVISGIVLLASVVLLIGLLAFNSSKEIKNFEECEAAGYPILESYPRQCKTPEGKTFVEDIDEPGEDSEDPDEDQSPEEQAESEDYYGRSTNYSCTTDTDCEVNGCGMEICKGTAEEELFSICIAQEKPLPDEAGYTCGCVSSGCAWTK
jgi:eight-cysteine-cluster-containing protein